MFISKNFLWYQKNAKEIQEKLKTDFKNGLSSQEVLKRQETYGKNIFKKEKKETFFDRLLKQVKSPLVIILLIASLATFFLKEYLDMSVILIALFINIAIGIFQENRASKAFNKLQQSQEKIATVIRDGAKLFLPADEVVPGDFIYITAGSYIPADARIITSYNLSANESALTGEWVDVPKNNKVIEKETSITGRFNMVYMGTLITSGNTEAIVVGTGNNTEIGFIAESLAKGEESITPMQKNIKKLAKFLAYLLVGIIFFIFTLGLIRGESLNEMLLISIALGVAVMPEGLPAAVTVVLALGMEEILKKKGLVRNLLATETLGSTTVILTDKTGTLTYAKMKVYAVITTLSSREKKTNFFGNDDEKFSLEASILSLSAFTENKKEKAITRGRPLETAILTAGLETGLSQKELLKKFPRLDLLPFEPELRFGASLNKIFNEKENRIYISGAPESLLERSEFFYENGKSVKITSRVREKFIEIQAEKSKDGMYLAAVAYKNTSLNKFPTGNKNKNDLFQGLVFCGIIALNDPVREDVAQAIETAKEAGTRVIMVTGDNLNTASKVASEVGIQKENQKGLTGNNMEKLSDEELYENLQKNHVFARVLPEQKLRIVKILKNSGEVVAMTGDGINDAPALKFADIGIALGDGTEVAKESADMILLNNSFSIIIKAIEEGRRMLDNLKKIVAYLLSTNFSEIFVIGGALMVGAPLPLLATQILWTNIVEEGFMNFAFAFEPKEKGLMKRNPRSQSMKNILSPNLKKLILIMSLITGIVLVILYFILLSLEMPIEKVRTIMFIVLSLDSVFFAFSLKNLHTPIWKINIFSNKYLLFSFSLSILALVSALTLPPLQKLLSLVPIFALEIPIVVGIGLFNLITIEIVKHFIFRNK